MTKSQNKKNEQHCIKQNEKSFTQKDLSLTELWQKGELEDGYYFIKMSYQGAILPIYYSQDYGFEYDDHFYDFEEISEVLAPVPSYDEWNASEKYIKSLEEKIKIYERIDKQHTNDSIAYNELAEENDKLKTENRWYSEQLNEAVKEIEQLKKFCEEFNALNVVKENEKLKEAVELIKKGLQETIDGYRMTPISRAELLLKELNEALK